MKKRLFSLALVLAMAVTLIAALSGCGAKLGEKYVSVDDSSVYLIFDGNTVALHENGNPVRNGTFTESAKTSSGRYLLRIWYEIDGTSTEERYWLDEKKETIYAAVFEEGVETVGEAAFIKQN